MVKKILFNESKQATGVLLDKGTTLFARNEVILSAGAFQSPQILMVSGIGPAEIRTSNFHTLKPFFIWELSESGASKKPRHLGMS